MISPETFKILLAGKDAPLISKYFYHIPNLETEQLPLPASKKFYFYIFRAAYELFNSLDNKDLDKLFLENIKKSSRETYTEEELAKYCTNINKITIGALFFNISKNHATAISKHIKKYLNAHPDLKCSYDLFERQQSDESIDFIFSADRILKAKLPAVIFIKLVILHCMFFWNNITPSQLDFYASTFISKCPKILIKKFDYFEDQYSFKVNETETTSILTLFEKKCKLWEEISSHITINDIARKDVEDIIALQKQGTWLSSKYTTSDINAAFQYNSINYDNIKPIDYRIKNPSLFSERLYKALGMNNLSQSEVVRLSGSKKSSLNPYFSKDPKKIPKRLTCKWNQITEILNVTPEYLLGITDDPNGYFYENSIVKDAFYRTVKNVKNDNIQKIVDKLNSYEQLLDDSHYEKICNFIDKLVEAEK